ncbi:hypothetical protein [Argonema antarcticum]|nr:hypothetical protein [Argonema antarcticum]MCL1474701.1 hypothetical protein [Argonema antarcticum A004/B2]
MVVLDYNNAPGVNQGGEFGIYSNQHSAISNQLGNQPLLASVSAMFRMA